MNLSKAFEAVAARQPDKIALFYGEKEYSFSDLLTESRRVAAFLQGEMGVKPGDRVAMWLKNCPEFIPTLFGIFIAGGIAVPVNNFLKPQEVSFILSDSGAEIMVTDDSLAAGLPELMELRPRLRCVPVDDYSSLPRDYSWLREADRATGEVAVIIYTSGTTGRPKGVMLSHGNLLHNVESCRAVFQCVDDDRLALLLPMFHSYMLTVGVLLPLLVGATIVLIRSVHPPRNVFIEVIQRQVTILPAIPQFFRSMASPQLNVELPSLRLCISGAAPLPLTTLNDFKAKFSFPLIEGYGLSEASPVVAKNPLNGVRKPGSIGPPIPNVEVSIQDEAGNLLPHDQIGELCVRGGNVMLGYWNQPEETARVMRNGWLLTGDIGYRDADGYYFITDRKKDMLLVNGINVYPREVEEVIYQFPGVKEASVIGIPNARKGEQPLAYVVANDGVTIDERELIQFVRSKIADYKAPRRIVFIPALPRNATGKVLKRVLREEALKAPALVEEQAQD